MTVYSENVDFTEFFMGKLFERLNIFLPLRFCRNSKRAFFCSFVGSVFFMFVMLLKFILTFFYYIIRLREIKFFLMKYINIAVGVRIFII